jgi:hypothetical protein
MRKTVSHFTLPREGELQDGSLEGTVDDCRDTTQRMGDASVAPVHIGDEQADSAGVAEHQEMLEEHAPYSVVLPGILDEESNFGAHPIRQDCVIGKRNDKVWLADGFGDQPESSR